MPSPTIRVYGTPPYTAAVIHGGPGAPGYMAPVARELYKNFGVAEPLQTKDRFDAQIEELIGQLKETGNPPVLIGSSYGAVLALITAARAPGITQKIIMVGSAVFDAANSAKVEKTRRARRAPETQREMDRLNEALAQASPEDENAIFEKLAALDFGSDVVDPSTRDLEILEFQYRINGSVWNGYKNLRDSGTLAEEIAKVRLQVTIVHGDCDPHPLEGIAPFLKSHLADVTVHVLAECGHYPWIERRAREPFFEILRRECVS